MHKRIQIFIPVVLSLAVLTSCATTGSEVSDSSEVQNTAAEEIAATEDLFAERDLEQDWDESEAIAISLNGDSADCDSDAVKVDGSTITITEEGTYSLSGTLEDGQIIVDAGDDAKVQLVLNGVSITSADFAAIYAVNADKLFITLSEGTENTLVNENGFTEIDDNNVDAVVFTKCDLTLNGSGTLVVESGAGHGIVSKDELTITGGIYRITAANHGLTGKDSVAISDGSFSLCVQEDGVHSDGDITITGGTWSIQAGDDGIHSDGNLTITGGDFSIPSCYEGIEGLTITIDNGTFDITSSDDGLNAANGTENVPGVAISECWIVINGGLFTIVSDGDCIDSNGDLTINGGTLNLTCNGNGNTAIDVDGTYTNNGGDVTTNDGSESNGGQMGGMSGGMPGQGGNMQTDGQPGMDGDAAAPGGGAAPNGGNAPGGETATSGQNQSGTQT